MPFTPFRFVGLRLGVVVLLIACDGPPTDPTRLVPADVPRAITDCGSQIILDPDSSCAEAGGGLSQPWYADTVDANAAFTSVSSYSVESEAVACPRDMTGTTHGTIRSRKSGRIYDFHSTGKWTIDWMSSAIFLPASQAVYNWPPGYWPAFDQNDGHYALIKIGKGRGACLGGGNVGFFAFYDVTMEGDDPKSASTPSGGGGDGGADASAGTTCHTEYIYVELNAGAGWYVWWEGYATVCG